MPLFAGSPPSSPAGLLQRTAGLGSRRVQPIPAAGKLALCSRECSRTLGDTRVPAGQGGTGASRDSRSVTSLPTFFWGVLGRERSCCRGQRQETRERRRLKSRGFEDGRPWLERRAWHLWERRRPKEVGAGRRVDRVAVQRGARAPLEEGNWHVPRGKRTVARPETPVRWGKVKPEGDRDWEMAPVVPG